MSALSAQVVAWNDEGIPPQIKIMERGRRVRSPQVVGQAFLTDHHDGYVDEYAVVLRGRQIGTVEIGNHSSHGGIWPDYPQITEERLACEVAHGAARRVRAD
ncbi:hypothetical protein AGRA3207_007537 [Actinomadura graeca]|uniref:Uncharacterized protein n=1 Tax=Actinomadura graeca TaxID=2750812 RepID=A0ABX8R4G5_9ACTN|nr:hypothetical protein [Actinomadura graeca]QXJ25966.1 hypothetical protein AGRA3207_007537 [Actinomadura graeca]